MVKDDLIFVILQFFFNMLISYPVIIHGQCNAFIHSLFFQGI